MGQKLSAGAQQELEVLTYARRVLDRLHNLVEQFAVAGKGQDTIAGQIGRAATGLGRQLLNAGLGVLADLANSLGMLAKRGGGPGAKLRGMRDLVAQLRPGIERAEKAVYLREAESADGAESAES